MKGIWMDGVGFISENELSDLELNDLEGLMDWLKKGGSWISKHAGGIARAVGKVGSLFKKHKSPTPTVEPTITTPPTVTPTTTPPIPTSAPPTGGKTGLYIGIGLGALVVIYLLLKKKK